MMKKLLSAMVCLCMICGMLSACTQKIEPTNHPSEPENSETVGVAGGSGGYDVHCEEYHEFLYELVEQLDVDEIRNWVEAVTEENKSVETDCSQPGVNIKTFIDRFQIPREMFEKGCHDHWGCIHNIDLLYSDDMDAIETYYQDIDARNATRIKQESLRRLKYHLTDKYISVQGILEKPEDERTAIEKEVVFENKVSMFRLLQLFDVDRATLEKFIWQEQEEFLQDQNSYKYQLDLVYNEDGTLKDFEIDPAKTVVELDAQFAGVENFFTD